MLHRHGSHAEAVARIGWCITERALGVVTGEVGAGKTVANQRVAVIVNARDRQQLDNSCSTLQPSARFSGLLRQ